MLPRQDPSRELLLLAEQQAGVLTSEQVAGHEVSRRSVERLVAQGQWRRLDRSLYLTHPAEPTWTSWA